VKNLVAAKDCVRGKGLAGAFQKPVNSVLNR